MIIFVIFGTVLATFLGALLASFSLKLSHKVLCGLQNFAIGGIFALIFIELIPEAIEGFNSVNSGTNKILNAFYVILIIVACGLLFFFLHELTHRLSHHHDHDKNDAEVCEDHGHTVEIFSSKNTTLVSALIFLSAISVHNIPEGLSFGVMFTNVNSSSISVVGITMACILFLHNLLIGFAMYHSFKNANKGNVFSISMTTLSSLPALIFAFIGFFLNYTLEGIATPIIFAISSGSLLYVLFIELLPNTYYEYKSKYSFVYILLGFALSLLLLNI